MHLAGTHPPRSEARFSIAPLVGFILLAFLAALPAAWIDSRTGYTALKLPEWAPPGGVFGPVWSILYLLMGISAWMVWQRRGWTGPMVPWVVQLVLNALWTPVFFGLGQPGLALVVILLLWFAIAATVAVFARVAPGAAWLLAPYFAWVTFAAFLNEAIWRMNP